MSQGIVKSRACIKFNQPDLIQERNGQFLLIWSEVPYWLVVDREFFGFLQTLNGKMPLEKAILSRVEWQRAEQDIMDCMPALIENRVLTNLNAPVQKDQADGNFVPIENISVNLTLNCNLRCGFCYNLNAVPGGEELSAQEVIDFLTEIKPLLAPNPTLTILGGEPLFFPDKLISIARAAQDMGIQTIVSTNGTLVTEKFAEEAKEIRLEVQVSLDGHTAELHDMVRGKGSFAKTLTGIEKLAAIGVYTILSLVIHMDNLPYLESFYRLSHLLKVNEARFINLKQMGGALDNVFKPVPIDYLVNRAYELFTQHPEFRALAGRDCFSILGNTCRYSLRRKSCGTGLQTLLLDSDGSIYPCLNCNRPEFRIGSIRDKEFHFRGSWEQSSILYGFRRHTFLSGSAAQCRNCPVKYWCLGGCHGETYALTGKLDLPANNCSELRTAIIDMFWMLSERPELFRRGKNCC